MAGLMKVEELIIISMGLQVTKNSKKEQTDLRTECLVFVNAHVLCIMQGTRLRMFALIVSVHPYCACKFTHHVVHQCGC